MGTHQSREQKLQTLYGHLKWVAATGGDCPSNIEIMRAVDAHSISIGPALLDALAGRGLITVERGVQNRRITIIETGQRTSPVKDVVARRRDSYKDAHAFRGDLPPERYVDRTPCGFCGVRGDVGCRHNRMAA
jgi:hypothetical protein